MTLFLRWTLLILALVAGDRAISAVTADGPPQPFGEGGSPPPPKP